VADRRLEWTGTLLVVVAAAGVWFAHHPDAPALVAASRWPVAGPMVERFRDAFRPPRQRAGPTGKEAAESGPVPFPPAPPSPPPARPQPGSAAAPDSGEVATAALPAAIDRSVVAPGPLPGRAADPARLAAIERQLGGAARTADLGPYRYLGDVEPPVRWTRIATALDAAYAARTGLAPRGRPAETVVVVADPERYRAVQRLEPRLAGVDSGGHTIAGLAVVEAPAGAPEIAEATLVHELVHLVNRRAIGPALPTWLDEGLAEDLAWTPFDDATGTFRWRGLRGSVRREGSKVELSGALAGIESLVRALGEGRLPTLDELTAMDWRDFVDADAPLRYSQSMWFVRFLLDGGDSDLARGFRAYLAGIASGGAVDDRALERALGRPLASLEPAFRAFLAAQKATRVDPAVAALARHDERVVP
jgi:hypothetical protein